MPKVVEIAGRPVGEGHPVYVIAEIGLNHNGDVKTAKQLIDAAALAGCDAVKFQKRTPELCVPPEQRNVRRETPWGEMTYMDYRYRVEFGPEQYGEIDRYCKDKGIAWFASCWDEPSVDFIERFDPPCYKVASASLTDDALLKHTAATGKPILLSTGMSTMEEIEHAVALLGHGSAGPAARHQHLPVQARGAEPEPDPGPEDAVRLPDRLLGARGGVADDAGRRDPGGLPGRAAHHPRPRDVGQRPGRLGRALRLPPPGARHPGDRAGDGRRRQARLRQRGPDPQEAATGPGA